MVRNMTHNSSAMSPRDSGRFITEKAKDVTISKTAVRQLAEKLLEVVDKQVQRWCSHELNPKVSDEDAVNWIFMCDVINFSFWSEDQDKKFCVKYGNGTWTGYWSLCAAVNRALKEGIPITSPKYYATVNEDTLSHLLRSDSQYEMPMIKERVQCLNEVGKILVEKYDGCFLNCIKKCDQSAQKLLQLIVTEFPCFRDVAEFEDKTVALYKRAQILIADIWACCQGEGHGKFTDIDTVTMFADYRIPQALVHFGVMQYSEALKRKLKEGHLFESGDREEVEIRGVTIWAVELLRDEMKTLLKEKEKGDDSQLLSMNAVQIDHYLWDYRRDHDQETSSIPFHRIRCIYY